MLGLSWRDVTRGSDPWTAVASITLLIQSHQALLARLGYIALLFYWYVFISREHLIYSQLLSELFRSKSARGGETDDLGKHWTLNIADTLVLTAFSRVVSYFFPDHYWKAAGFAVFLNLFVLGHHVVQLWMQTQIARLIRLNANVWRWRDWIIDNSILWVIQKVDGGTARAASAACWWMLHRISLALESKNTNNYMMGIFVLGVTYPSNPSIKFWATWSRRVLFYRFWFHNLSKFTNPNPPEYKYTPLEDPENIRVILLYPRFGFGKVCCSLLQGPHMRTLFYEAISYNWGSGKTTEEILVDGCKMKVTRSSYEILTSYSSLFLPKLLWIDALCIDQGNDAEKSQQVPLMEKIYRSAIITTVFLGRSPLANDRGAPSGTPIPHRYDGLVRSNQNTSSQFEDARLTFDLLNEIHILEGNALRGNDMKTYQLFESLKLSGSKRRQWAAVLRMLNHPWFSRIWVIQEVALSAEVQIRYGDEIIDWDLLAKGIQRLKHARHFQLWLELEHGIQLLHPNVFNLSRMHQFRERYRPKGWNDRYRWRGSHNFNLSNVLAKGASFEATNPRDLIFGVMSLCVQPVKVDYSLLVEEIYLSAAKRLLDDRATGLLFHSSGVRSRREGHEASALPSWVPDWRAAPKYKPLQNAVSWNGKVDFKTGGEGPSSMCVKNGRILAVSGYLVDSVAELGPALFNTSHSNNAGTIDELHHLAVNYTACIALILKLINMSGGQYPYAAVGQDHLEAFRRILFLDRKWISWNYSSVRLMESFPRWEEKLKLFRDRNIPAVLLAERKDAFYELLKYMDEVTKIIRPCCGGRRFFTTEKGYMGLCPPYAEPGDLIYVVPGIHTPIIMRRDTSTIEEPQTQGAASRVELVGECYVHGLMNGEALAMGTSLNELEII